MNVKKRRFEYIGFVLPLLLAVICLLSVTTNNYQAFLPIPMPQELVGEYEKIGQKPEHKAAGKGQSIAGKKLIQFYKGIFKR